MERSVQTKKDALAAIKLVFANPSIDKKSGGYNMGCLFGHKWNGCKCEKCGKTRDERHKFTQKGQCLVVCTVCGTEQARHHIDYHSGMCIVCDHRPVPEIQFLVARQALDYANLNQMSNRYEATKQVKKAIELYPDFAPAYECYGEICDSMGYTDHAIKHIKKAILLYEKQGHADYANNTRDKYKNRFFYKKLI